MSMDGHKEIDNSIATFSNLKRKPLYCFPITGQPIILKRLRIDRTELDSAITKRHMTRMKNPYSEQA